MRSILLTATGAIAAIVAVPGAAQTGPAPSALAGAMPRSDPAELPKVFAVSIAVTDLDRAEKFYREALGAVQVVRLHDRERSVQFKSGVSVVLHLARAPSATGAAGFILQTADIDALIARVVVAGGHVDRGPNDGTAKLSFGVRAAQIRDPDGVGIEVIQFPTGAN